jgi:hypothetical protein
LHENQPLVYYRHFDHCLLEIELQNISLHFHELLTAAKSFRTVAFFHYPCGIHHLICQALAHILLEIPYKAETPKRNAEICGRSTGICPISLHTSRAEKNGWWVSAPEKKTYCAEKRKRGEEMAAPLNEAFVEGAAMRGWSSMNPRRAATPPRAHPDTRNVCW